MRYILSLTFLMASLLSACAPIPLLRTADVLEKDEVSVDLAAAYSVNLNQIPPCEPDPDYPSCFFEWFGPAYLPMAPNALLRYTRGYGYKSEFSVALQVSVNAGLRLGGKTQFLDTELNLAADYGASLYLDNASFDLGLLASYTLPEADIYGGVRGFGLIHWLSGTPSSVIFSLTGGARVPYGKRHILLELSLSTTRFNGIGSFDIPAVGWQLSPAIGVRF